MVPKLSVARKRASCFVCEGPFDVDAPAVADTKTLDEPIRWLWVPFLDDWPGDGTTYRFAHPECFVREFGVTSLLEVIRDRDVHQRDWLVQMQENTAESRKARRQQGDSS
jgi:hypothetical protein